MSELVIPLSQDELNLRRNNTIELTYMYLNHHLHYDCQLLLMKFSIHLPKDFNPSVEHKMFNNFTDNYVHGEPTGTIWSYIQDTDGAQRYNVLFFSSIHNKDIPNFSFEKYSQQLWSSKIAKQFKECMGFDACFDLAPFHMIIPWRTGPYDNNRKADRSIELPIIEDYSSDYNFLDSETEKTIVSLLS